MRVLLKGALRWQWNTNACSHEVCETFPNNSNVFYTCLHVSQNDAASAHILVFDELFCMLALLIRGLLEEFREAFQRLVVTIKVAIHAEVNIGCVQFLQRRSQISQGQPRQPKETATSFSTVGLTVSTYQIDLPIDGRLGFGVEVLAHL